MPDLPGKYGEGGRGVQGELWARIPQRVPGELAGGHSQLPGLQIQHQNGPPLTHKYHYLDNHLLHSRTIILGGSFFPWPW